VKTISLKKVSAIAVASLGFGLLSVVPAQALSGDLNGKVICTSSSTAVNAATAGGATASTANAPATFTVVAGSTFKCTVAQETDYEAVDAVAYSGSDFSTGSLTSTTWDATTGSGSATTTDPTTAAAVYSDAAPTVAGTYYLKISEGGGTSAFVKFTVVNLGAAVGDGFSATSGTATAASATSTTLNAVAGPANTVSLFATRSSTLNGIVIISGASATIKSVSANGTIAADKLSAEIASGGVSANSVVIATPTTGTITANYFVETAQGSGIYGATAASTVTITVNATALSGVPSAGKMGAIVVAQGTAQGSYDTLAEIAAGTDLADSVDGRVSGVASAVIYGFIGDSAGAAVTGASVGFSLSGPGTVSASVDGSTSQGLADGGKIDSITTTSTGLVAGRVYSDGSSGTATITVTYGTTVIATKKVVFYGQATTIAATQNLYVAAASTRLGAATAGGTATAADVANTYAAIVKVTDQLGNPALGTVSALIADTTVISAVACTAHSTIVGTYNCEVTGAAGATAGKSTTVTMQVLLANGVSKASASPMTFKIGGTAAKATIAPAATSYAPGTLVTLNVTVTDAANNTAPDLDTNIFAAGIKTSIATSKDWTAAGAGEANVAVINGVAKLTFYAPLTAGPVVVDLPVESAFNLSSTITKLTTTVNIADANQAAITASLAALNAKIVALNALIAKIMKRLNIR
jgi:hypothetical protein